MRAVLPAFRFISKKKKKERKEKKKEKLVVLEMRLSPKKRGGGAGELHACALREVAEGDDNAHCQLGALGGVISLLGCSAHARR